MICLFLSGRLSANWVESVESRILTFTFRSQHGFAVDPLYSFPPTMSAYVVQDDSLDPGEEYITYAYRTSHQVLWWLPTKLAEWIRANFCEELNIPDKQGPLWIAVDLNAIITGNLVGGPHGHLHTFECIQWENDLFNGRPKARCYPFDIRGHRFRHTRIHRYILYIVPDIDTIIVLHLHDIVPDIVYDIVYDIILDYLKLMMLLVQDCVCVVAPYPFRIEPLKISTRLEIWM